MILDFSEQLQENARGNHSPGVKNQQKNEMVNKKTIYPIKNETKPKNERTAGGHTLGRLFYRL